MTTTDAATYVVTFAAEHERTDWRGLRRMTLREAAKLAGFANRSGAIINTANGDTLLRF